MSPKAERLNGLAAMRDLLAAFDTSLKTVQIIPGIFK